MFAPPLAAKPLHDTTPISTHVRLNQASPSVRMRISRCLATDRSVKECLWLGAKSCAIAFKATEVVRGRLGGKTLDDDITQPIILQLANLRNLLTSDFARTASKAFYGSQMPLRIRGLHAVLLSPNRFDACIALIIDGEYHWANVVLSVIGSRWMCTTLQLA